MMPHNVDFNQFTDVSELVGQWTMRRMSGSDFAEDVTQEVWVSTLPHLPYVVNIEAYLFIATRNGVSRHFQQVRRLQEVPLDESEPPSAHPNGQNSADLGTELVQCVNELVSATYDEVMLELAMEVMSDLELEIFGMRAQGMRYAQIEAITGRSEAALRKITSRARSDIPKRFAALAQTLPGVRVPMSRL